MSATHTVYVPEGTFGVLDAGEIPVQTADWSNGLAIPMAYGALIVTGIHTGEIRATATSLTGPPSVHADDVWEEIVEVSVRAPTGSLRVESLEHGPVDGLAPLSPAGPGWYRLRVHTRGRSLRPDKTNPEPVEDYLVMTWPAPHAGADILRTSDRMKHNLAHAANAPQPQPPAPSQSEEQETLRRRLLQGYSMVDGPQARVTQRDHEVKRRTWCSSSPARPFPDWEVSCARHLERCAPAWPKAPESATSSGS